MFHRAADILGTSLRRDRTGCCVFRFRLQAKPHCSDCETDTETDILDIRFPTKGFSGTLKIPHCPKKQNTKKQIKPGKQGRLEVERQGIGSSSNEVQSSGNRSDDLCEGK